MILQPFLSVCEISQTPFSLAKWFLKHPDICYRHWEIFSIRFLLSKPKILLVNHQLQDSLAFKLVKRLNIYVIVSFILCSYIYLSGACSQRGDPLESFEKQVKFRPFVLPYLLTLYFYFLTKLCTL